MQIFECKCEGLACFMIEKNGYMDLFVDEMGM